MRLSRSHKFSNWLTLTALLLGLTGTPAWSAGTPAGTLLTNQAFLSFWTAATGNITTGSNVTLSRVDELIDVTVTWQDGASVTVAPGAQDQVLTFRVTNTGNGHEQYGLTADPALLGDGFDPTAAQIYLDDGNGSFSAASDTLYAAISKPNLNPDQAITVFIVGDIPAGLAGALTGQVSLAASSVTFDGVAATVLPGFGDLATTAVRKPAGGQDADTGVYLTTAPGPGPDPDPDPDPDTGGLTLDKAVAVTGPGTESEPVPGATLTYQITARYIGTGKAVGVLISDPIPAITTYRAGSLRLNGTSLTDASDGDSGAFSTFGNGTVNVILGDLDAASPVQTITFEVSINP